MSNASEQSEELGHGLVTVVVGDNTPQHPQLDAQTDEALHAQMQAAYANRTPGDTTEDSDTMLNVTGNNSPVPPIDEHDGHTPPTRTNANSTRYNTRSSMRSRSARNTSFAPRSGDTSNDEDEVIGGDVFEDDAHTGDGTFELPSSTCRKPTRKAPTAKTFMEEGTSDVALAIQEIRQRSWKSKTNVHQYREQLVTDIGHYVNMMDRLMDIFESPEIISPDDNANPIEVITQSKKAIRRIHNHLAELEDCQQRIDDVKKIWFHWIGHIPSNYKDEEMDAREQFINIEGTDLYANTWRRYTKHRQRIHEEEDEAEIAMEWARDEMDLRRQLQETQPAQTTHIAPTPRIAPTADTSVEPPASVIRTVTDTTRVAPLFGTRATTTPTPTVTTTTSATASCWAPTAASTPATTTRVSSTPPVDQHTSRVDIGLKAINQVAALRSQPTSSFSFGTGQSTSVGQRFAANPPTRTLQTTTQDQVINSTLFHKPTETTRPEKINQQLRFAAQNQVYEITPNKNEDTRTSNQRSRSSSPQHGSKPNRAKNPPNERPTTQTAPTSDAPTPAPPTELSTVVSALKLVMSRLTNIEEQLQARSTTAPATTTSTSANTQSGSKLRVTADGRTTTPAAETSSSTNPEPMLRERADGTYVIPLLPSPEVTQQTHPQPTTGRADPSSRMRAAYGMAANDGFDFGDGIRVSAMDGRNLTPEVAASSPVGPKPPIYEKFHASSSTLPTGGITHGPAFAHSSARIPEPKPYFGEFFDWPRFASEWTNFVHTTCPDQFTLMTLLKKLLKGNAQTTAQRYDGHTSEEYDDLWEALVTRFNRPEYVVRHYLNTFKDIHAPTRETIPDLRQFHGETCVAINKLKRANRDVNNEMFTITLQGKINTPKLKAHLRQKQQETTRSGREWHTTAILNAMEEFIQEMEELEADNKEFGHNRSRSFRPQRTFCLQDGKRIRIRDEESVEWVDSDEDDHPSRQEPTSTRDCPQKKNVHVTFGEHQKKPFGKRSTPANFAPTEQTKTRKPRTGANGQKQRGRCVFCDNQKHRSLDCTKYKTHSSRTKRLAALNKCSYCIRDGHSLDACYIRKRHIAATEDAKSKHCDYCHELHNWLVCPTKFPDKKEERSKSPPPPTKMTSEKITHLAQNHNPDDDHTNPMSDEEIYNIEDTFTDCGTAESSDDEEVSPPRRSHNFNAVAHGHPTEPTSTQTLLMTTHIPVINPDAQITRDAVPIFFDQGSDKTYITQSLSKDLGLPVNRTFHSIIHTFMDREPNGRQVEVWEVEFDVRLRDGSTLHIVADAVEDFAAPMPTVHGRSKAVAHIIANPELPVPVVCETPQILIGTDYLNEFDIIRRRRPLNNGFYVYDSRAGPLLNGKGAATEGLKGPQVHKIQKIFKVQTRPADIRASSKTPTEDTTRTQPTNDALLAALHSLSSLEALGIQSSETIDDSAEVLAKHRETLRRNPDGRYETGLPWLSFVDEMRKSPHKKSKILPTNYKPALARINSIFRQHSGNPQVMGTYHDTFMEYIARGIIEIVSRDDVEGLIVHYLPHHPVFRADKPTKLRIVFDGSCRCTRYDRSINDCLHCGPNLLESIVGILLRSRFPELLLIGDIEKAFLQISIRPEDRDALRFLWLKDPTKPPTPDNLLVLRFCRVPFGLSASPFLLLATVDHHLRSSTDPTAMEIRRNMYSDNVFLFADSIDEAMAKHKSSKAIFTDANMNIREFISNSEELNQAIPELDRAKSTKEATLGLEWDNIKDVWRYRMPDPHPMVTDNKSYTPTTTSVPTAPHHDRPDEHSSTSDTDDATRRHVSVCRKVQHAKNLTMRVMTSVIHSLWDPFSLFCPVTLEARLLLQKVTNTGFGWDDKLPADITDSWTQATKTWPNMTFEVKRHILASPRPHIFQMHCFVDASGVAFAAVIYLRICDGNGNVHITPIFAKSRVNTKKPVLTIPRLELMSVLIGCRMIEYLRKELPPTVPKPTGAQHIPTYLWCDNQGALYWIKDSAHRYGRFVQNRLDEIRRVDSISFRYINTHENPADVASRGATAPELRAHDLWWNGPSFLRSTEDAWPTQPDNFQPFQMDLLGLDARPPLPTELDTDISTFAVQRAQKPQNQKPTLLELILAGKADYAVPPVKYMPHSRRALGVLRRVTVHMLRFAQRLLHRRGRALTLPLLKDFRPEHPPNTVYFGTNLVTLTNGRTRTLHLPTVREEDIAERLLIWSAQQAHRPSRDLVDQFQLARGPDGLLRCHGRIQHSELPTRTIQPIWLPECSRIAKQIAFDIHIFHKHAPLATTLGLLRNKYWVARGRRFLSALIRHWCAGCTMVRGPRFRHPQYAALPAERTQPCRPFAHIGLDLFGPYVVYTGPRPDNSQTSTKTRRRAKITRDLPPNMQKVWGVIFTCMATRAVHLEVVHSQSAAHLLLAFDSFASRRGLPENVTSDNGSNIVLVHKTLDSIWKELIEHQTSKDLCRAHGINWHFITAEAPWQGGFYEKLVHTVKRSLNTAIGRRHISLPHFTQLLTRVEHTVNCRPLTFQSDSEVSNIPIRPIDFLQPLATVYPEDPIPQDEDGDYNPHRLTSAEQLHEAFRLQQQTLDRFWRRWQQEYLLSLRERQKAQNDTATLERTPQIGEWVFVDDDDFPDLSGEWVSSPPSSEDATASFVASNYASQTDSRPSEPSIGYTLWNSSPENSSSQRTGARHLQHNPQKTTPTNPLDQPANPLDTNTELSHMTSNDQRTRDELRKLTAQKPPTSAARAQIPRAAAQTHQPRTYAHAAGTPAKESVKPAARAKIPLAADDKDQPTTSSSSTRTSQTKRMPWSKLTLPSIAQTIEQQRTEEPSSERSAASSVAQSFAQISKIPNWADPRNDSEWENTPTDEVSGDNPPTDATAPDTPPTDNTHQGRGTSGQTDYDSDALDELSDTDRVDEDDQNVKPTGAHTLYYGQYVIDAHIHMMEYTGAYFDNAQTYTEWMQDFPEDWEFAGAINVLHDPALWGDANTDQTNSAISYVHNNYAHIMPTGKIIGLGVGCHPKFCDYDRYDEDTYSVARVETALDRIFNNDENPTFHGKVPVVVGECGLEHGVSKNEEGKPLKQPRDAQVQMLKAHIRIAKKYNKPIMLHIRGKTFDQQQALERHAIAIFQEMEWPKHLSIIRHSFTGGPDTAAEWLENWEKTYFSFSLASRGNPQSVNFMDNYEPELHHVIIETDAPLLSRDVPGNRGLRPQDNRRRPAHSNDLIKVINMLHDQRVDTFAAAEEALHTLGDNVFNAYELDQEAVIDALEADITPTENPQDWKKVFPDVHTGIPRQRQQRVGRQGPQQPPAPAAAADQPSRRAGRSGSPRRAAEERREAGHWHRADSPRRRAQINPPRIPTEAPLTLRPLPQLPEAIPHNRRERISREEATRALLIQIDNRSVDGLELFRQCADMHKRPKCNGTTVRQQFPSLEDRELDRMGLSPEEYQLALAVRDLPIPSILHLVLLEWALRIPRSANNRYRLVSHILDQNVQQILFLWEEYLIAHTDAPQHALAREYIYSAVHKWSFCCKPLQDQFKRFKPVGPVLYMVRAPPDASDFIKETVKFIAQNVPTGIDNNRAKRLAKGRQEPERTVINSTVLFVGDTNAAALASCCTMPGAQYVQLYRWNELHAFLDNAYFGHQVLAVVISIGRADLPQYRAQNGTSEFEKLVKNYLRQLIINFPHVAFHFLFPPYDHSQREPWRNHIASAYNGTLEYPQKVDAALLDFPEAFLLHANRFQRRAPTEDDEVDAHGNVTRLGLQMVIEQLQRLPGGPFSQIFDPEAEVAPLRGGPLREADYFEFVPRSQHHPSIGPGDLVYDESEEPTYLTAYPEVADERETEPTGVEDTPSKSPPRQRARIDSHSSGSANSRPRTLKPRDPKRKLTLSYDAALVEPPAASSVPTPLPSTSAQTAPDEVALDISGRTDTAQIFAQIATMAFEQANAAAAPNQFQRFAITAGTATLTLDASPTVIAYLLGKGLLQVAVPQKP